MKNRKTFSAIILIFIFLSTNQIAFANGEKFYRTELYFGMDIPGGGGEVSEEDWNKFVDTEITARFPDGFTVLQGYGQFKDSAGEIERENSRVVILFYPKKTRVEVYKKIEEIRAAYKKQFRQESVLRLDYIKSVEVSF